ncbi:MAG: ABC transporter ATP-binding protein [Tepidimonas sp.]|uniref:ABC transporter ATP-binding protein n=1 Tax=Tepidimonas sp. TaxID=2002775 RepID=UPI00298F22EC|nr:ABC transporter ATP-binding protein [Tepidimonas sp.]MCS6809677.1 ABC transporter ATP-binding protein [Tepidimonas sp.]MDW8337336.1 ABC transporter ATP-binding protein [Tepidimonas sp.]
MRSEPVLRVRHLAKSFSHLPASPWAAMAALLGLGRRPLAAGKRVLHDISFDLMPGQALAIIGRNGSGKSTLLKLITGSLVPDAGSISIAGRISAILELGAGFDLDATGRQNMAMQAALWGVQAEELARHSQAIIDYSELGAAIDEPVRTYSSGMMLRLAFSIAIHAQADVLIVDEALAVGDARFQQKCMASIRAHLSRGGALLLVSHDLNSVKTLCQHAILLQDGRIVQQGAPAAVCDAYLARLLTQADGAGDQAAAVTHGAAASIVELLINGQPRRDVALRTGDWLEIRLTLQAHTAVDNLAAGFMLHDARGQDLFGVNTQLARQPIALHQAGQTCTVTLRVQLLLGAGHYTVTVAVHDADDYTRNVIYWGFGAIAIEVVDPSGDSVGHCKLPHHLDVQFQSQPGPLVIHS